jgi:MinD superfamily P-loop ATPase
MGCPVISAVSGVDFALIVTEPSLAGIHDLERVLETTEHFGVPAAVCINKVDISPAGARKIRAISRHRDVHVLGEIPFDVTVTEAMVAGRTITEFSPQSEISRILRNLWQRIQPKLTADEDVTSSGANVLRV